MGGKKPNKSPSVAVRSTASVLQNDIVTHTGGQGRIAPSPCVVITIISLWSQAYSSCKNKFEKAEIKTKQKAPDADYKEAINMQTSNLQSPSEEGVGVSLSQEHQKLEVKI